MSFLDRILGEAIVGNERESAAFSTGADGGFYGRTMKNKPKAIMIRPMNSTWEHNPVIVRTEDEDVADEEAVTETPVAESDESDNRVDSIVEDIDQITSALFGS